MCGYDTKTSLINIKQSNLVDIERYINGNRNRFEEVLKDTTYENGTFQFLPGHVSLILLFPELLCKSKSKSKFQYRNKPSENKTTSDHPGNINIDGGKINADSNADTSADEHMLDDAKVKKQLIDKINKFASKKSFNANLNETHFLEYQSENCVAKCRVKCPFCSKKFVCNYKSHWTCSNLTTHLKTHVRYEEYEVEENVDELNEKSNGPPTKIMRIVENNNISMNELHMVLNTA